MRVTLRNHGSGRRFVIPHNAPISVQQVKWTRETLDRLERGPMDRPAPCIFRWRVNLYNGVSMFLVAVIDVAKPKGRLP